ncbi:hypothetical protein EYZ11_000102 [Aspergillus tanneri]|uniref:Uncharacterized protein n=1 Tax=Aspergillus tanneri TaxID=1220188 RepID=A0A4S3JXU5_9EURO|nr:hypothetical protein EYZ11_000102 [Aspergillus tanneri]
MLTEKEWQRKERNEQNKKTNE